jgi:hypothetical protein
MILDETRERFLKAIAKEVDLARVAEIHFFPPIRQGGVESGVAVIAAVRAVPAADAEAVELPTMSPDGAVNEATQLAVTETEDVELEEPRTAVDRAEAAEAGMPDEAGPPALDGSPTIVDEYVSDAPGESGTTADASADEAELIEPAPPDRHVIYTARYRLTLKGPDRGKWEANVVAEADAPIVTLEAVVRGVQQRAGDVDEPTRMTGDDVRSSLPATTA